MFRRGLVLSCIFRLVPLIEVVSLLPQRVTLLSFSPILSLTIIRVVIVLLTISLAIVLVLFPLLVFIVGTFGCSAADVLLLGLDSSEGIWGFHVFVVVLSIWRFRDVLDFFVVVVVSIVVVSFVVVIVVLIIFIREVKLDPELAIPLTLNNKLLGRFTGSQHIPAFHKLLYSTNRLLISEDFINIIDVVSIIERGIEPNFLLGTVFEFE